MFKIANLIAYVLVLIGALNWLLISAWQLDVVAEIFGSTASVGSRIVYGIIGVAALWLIFIAIYNMGNSNCPIRKDRISK